MTRVSRGRASRGEEGRKKSWRIRAVNSTKGKEMFFRVLLKKKADWCPMRRQEPIPLRARKRRSSLLRLHFKRVSSLRCLLKRRYPEKNIKTLQLVIPLRKRVRRAKKIQSFTFRLTIEPKKSIRSGNYYHAREKRIGREKLPPFSLFSDDSHVVKKLGALFYSNNIVPRRVSLRL